MLFRGWWRHYLDCVSAAGMAHVLLSLLLLELDGPYVTVMRLHVNAADVLVRPGVNRDDSR